MENTWARWTSGGVELSYFSEFIQSRFQVSGEYFTTVKRDVVTRPKVTLMVPEYLEKRKNRNHSRFCHDWKKVSRFRKWASTKLMIDRWMRHKWRLRLTGMFPSWEKRGKSNMADKAVDDETERSVSRWQCASAINRTLTKSSAVLHWVAE